MSRHESVMFRSDVRGPNGVLCMTVNGMPLLLQDDLLLLSLAFLSGD